MPRPLLYAQFEDSKYTPQFVGSLYPELAQTQQVLNQRYDLAQDQDSKTAAALNDLLQNTHEKDKAQAEAVYGDYLGRLQERSKSGEYERMLPQTVQDSRKFNVNASKFIEEKKRIDSYLKQLDDNKEISNSQKADLKRMALSNQASLNYNPKLGVVEGSGFKADDFAKDIDIPEKYNKLTEGFIPDQTSWNGGKFIREKVGNGEDRLMYIERGGHKRYVTPNDVKNYVSDLTKADPEVQGYLDRLARQKLHQVGEDWRNPNQDAYRAIRSKVDEEALSPVVKAMANKFGFKQVNTDFKAQFDPLDMFRKKASLASATVYDDNARQTVPSTTLQEGLNDVDLEKLTKDRTEATHSVNSAPMMGQGLPISFSGEQKRGKTIQELGAETDPNNGTPLYPGLTTVANLVGPKSNSESEQQYAKRIDPLYKSFRSKIKTHQAYQEDLGAESKPYTDVVFGTQEGEGKEKIRTGGGYFSNSPVWIEQDGKFTKFANGAQALEEGAITKQDLNKFSVTGINHNYGDFGGAFEAAGNIGDKHAKIYVGGSAEHRKYSEPLSMVENIINQGEPTAFQTKLLTAKGELPVELYVEPLKEGSFSMNGKGEFGSIEPQITIQYQDGQTESMPYKTFKQKLIKANPYKDPILNKQRSNEGKEIFKDVLMQDELGQ